MTEPSGGEPSVIDMVTDFVQHYLPTSMSVMLGGLLWRSSSRVTKFEQTQAEHAERIREHSARIVALETADAKSREIVAALPTREDLRAQTDQLQNQIQHGFDNVIRLVSRRD